MFISTVGLSVSITIPYCLGKCSGKQITEEIFQKYPKAKKLSEYQKQNTFFTLLYNENRWVPARGYCQLVFWCM